ncbi:MAG: hypothetical protein AAF517_00665 [Planctomycetota bacterium]
MSQLIGSTVRGYRVERLIESTPGGRVYLARQLAVERDVSLWLFPKRWYDDPQLRASFEREVEEVGRLRHPAAVEIHEFFSKQDRFFASTEVLKSGSLASQWTHGTAPPLASVLEGILDVVGCLHESSADVPCLLPSRVFVGADGRFRTWLLGAKTECDEVRNEEVEDGSPQRYLAPEMWSGAAESALSYSIGSLLFEAVSGAVPPPSQMRSLREGGWTIPAVPKAYRELRPLIQVLTEASVEQRLSDLGALEARLRQVVRPRDTKSRELSVEPQANRRGLETALGWFAFAGCVLAAVAVTRDLWNPQTRGSEPDASTPPAGEAESVEEDSEAAQKTR